MGGFMKDAVKLFVITLISGLCLGAVYGMTKTTIEQQQIAAQLETYKVVYAEAANFQNNDALTEQVDDFGNVLAESGLDLGNAGIESVLEAVDGSGNVIGHMLNVYSKDGYGGMIELSVGITSEGEITGIGFLTLEETAGLGMKAKEPAFKDQFAGKNAEQLVLTKSGASADNEIDAISGATITSTAVTNAVNAALYFAHNCISQ